MGQKASFCVMFKSFEIFSQKTSKCGKNISDTLGYASCATFSFLPHFDVICDLLLNRRTATWNLFVNYNIASRAAQSNSVYVIVFKIPIVLADGVSKWFSQNFFCVSSPCQRRENIIFRYNNGYKEKLSPPVAKQRQFSDRPRATLMLLWCSPNFPRAP